MKKFSYLYTDEDAWSVCPDRDLWVFDKLILSKKLGYVCGPHGLNVPKPNHYVVRPCVNVCGMSLDARIQFIEDGTDDCMPGGSFWCEVFTGRHLSVDYHYGTQDLTVEGIPAEVFGQFKQWNRVEEKMPLPDMMLELAKRHEWINVEYIGGKIIEVHLRRNPDFIKYPDADHIIVVKENDETYRKGYVFVESEKLKFSSRIGFLVSKKNYSR